MITLAAVIAVSGIFGAISSIHTQNNALVAHLTNGLTNPLDQKDSTMLLHLQMFLDGIWKGIKNPAGYGLGSTTIAASKFDGGGGSSEVDLSNMFISDGIIGGLLYLSIFIMILRMAFRMAVAKRDLLGLIMVGLLVFSAGQWEIGGNYSTAALIWLTVGYLDKRSVESKLHS